MFPTTYTFQYNPENLHAFSYTFSMDHLGVPAMVVCILLVYLSIY